MRITTGQISFTAIRTDLKGDSHRTCTALLHAVSPAHAEVLVRSIAKVDGWSFGSVVRKGTAMLESDFNAASRRTVKNDAIKLAKFDRSVRSLNWCVAAAKRLGK